MIKDVKPAATIMLAREVKNTLEVLLLKRNKALAFAGGLWVFPGGKIEENELEESQNELEAAKRAAVRETKEEANISVTSSELIFFSHWTTPVTEPRRFATWFFFGKTEYASSEVTIDDSEIKEHLWIQPQAALNKMRDGELGMMPPTIISLQLIRKCRSIEDIKNKLSVIKPPFILPVLQPMDGKMFCMYEGDAGYASENAKLKGARHRTILDISTGEFKFEYSDCEGIEPINGGMH